MKRENIDKILEKVLMGWDKKHGLKNINKEHLEAMLKSLILVLESSPHEDGYMRVSNIDDPSIVHLVPFEEIILNGLKGEDVEKYPIEKRDEQQFS